MGRLKALIVGLGIWLIMLLPWGRNKMLNRSHRFGFEEGQYMFAKQLAHMNREQRRAAIRHIVRNFKKT